MRYALIIAGGSGTRLWPMSTRELPKQLIPLIDGKSLLQVAVDRLERLLPREQVYICAGQAHRQVILDRLPTMTADRLISEPMGRDTLNAVGLGTGVLGLNDPDAVVGIFTADHLITPEDEFCRIVEQGYQLAEAQTDSLVTFGIEPTYPATGYGYLQLGQATDGNRAFVVDQFREKPDAATAERYVTVGPQAYLWNSGMFIWQAQTLMRCIERFAPENYEGLRQCIDAWPTPERDAVLSAVYPKLKKISIDYAVMEPASEAADFNVVAVPMPLRWLDVGSWPSYAETLEKDAAGNVTANCETLLMDSRDVVVVSEDPKHLIATIGVQDVIIVHTPHATLVCQADQAERIKDLHQAVGEKIGTHKL